MREIKFRAWDQTFKDMFIVTGLNLADGEVHGLEKDGIAFDRGLEHVVLMQYTGLKDKNGTEIYEGDIVTFQSVDIEVREVVFNDGAFHPRGWAHNTFFKLEPEVIGNRYENPELLQDDKS